MVNAPAGTNVELQALRIVHGGFTLARQPSGEVALLKGALPGERVMANLRKRRGVWQGDVVTVIDAAPGRRTPPEHPGLDYGHADYETQLALKREVVKDALRRAGAPADAPDVPAVRRSATEWHYRNVIQPAATREGLGYRRPGTSDVVLLQSDPTASHTVNQAWRTATDLGVHAAPGVKELLIRANSEGQALMALIGTAPAKALLDLAHELVNGGLTGVVSAPYDARGRFRGGVDRLAGKRTILEQYGEVTVTVNASSFAQPNPGAAGQLFAELKEWAGTGERAWELYAGNGVIALHLAESYGEVTAVEIDRGAVKRGERDAERLGFPNVHYVRTDARAVTLPRDLDLLIVDPPRAGLSAELREAIAECGARRLIYVSCDVATWARDVTDFSRRGLTLTRFQPYDFFPQTHHVELLSELSRE